MHPSNWHLPAPAKQEPRRFNETGRGIFPTVTLPPANLDGAHNARTRALLAPLMERIVNDVPRWKPAFAIVNDA